MSDTAEPILYDDDAQHLFRFCEHDIPLDGRARNLLARIIPLCERLPSDAERLTSRSTPSPDAATVERLREPWQPIESAPKDRSWILGYESRIGMNTKYVPHEVMRWSPFGNGAWRSSADKLCEPTHWQPLSEPLAALRALPQAGGDSITNGDRGGK